MNWALNYRLNNLDGKISKFISNCEESIYVQFDKTQIRRDRVIDILLDKECEFETMEYLNDFLSDFSDKVKFIEYPVFTIYHVSEGMRIENRNYAVHTYDFESYRDLKNLINENIGVCYVFSYLLSPQPTLVGNDQKFTHRLRALFIDSNDDVISTASFGSR